MLGKLVEKERSDVKADRWQWSWNQQAGTGVSMRFSYLR
jgi:hypothetical protein